MKDWHNDVSVSFIDALPDAMPLEQLANGKSIDNCTLSPHAVQPDHRLNIDAHILHSR